MKAREKKRKTTREVTAFERQQQYLFRCYMNFI